MSTCVYIQHVCIIVGVPLSFAQVDKLIHLTDNTYTYDEVIAMELKLLRVLDFDVHPPVATDFLDRFLMCLPPHDKVRLCRAALRQGDASPCRYMTR